MGKCNSNKTTHDALASTYFAFRFRILSISWLITVSTESPKNGMGPSTIPGKSGPERQKKVFGRTTINDCSVRDESYLILGTTTRITHQLGTDPMSETNNKERRVHNHTEPRPRMQDRNHMQSTIRFRSESPTGWFPNPGSNLTGHKIMLHGIWIRFK